jgi:tetratricopeptide (TPR) repeat protein
VKGADAELYSVQDAARLFGLGEARLRYWAQTGFVGPSVRRRGRFYYTFQDLISLKTLVSLLDRGVPTQRVRKNLEALRRRLPELAQPLAQLRICSDGDELVVLADDAPFQPASGQLVMSFAVRDLATLVADVTPLRTEPVPPAAPANDPLPETAYGCFTAGVAALDGADDARAEVLFRRALALDGALAAAWTNLGNLLERRGERGAAREAYEQALARDPDQPEARYNLANVHADAGELELALAEYRRVAAQAPGFADVHFNLGLALLGVGAVAQARTHLRAYLDLDEAGDWAARARTLLDGLRGCP